MNLNAAWCKHTLNFKFEAGTSRGVLHAKDSYYLKISDNNGIYGIGEAGPLMGLSVDFGETATQAMTEIVAWLNNNLINETTIKSKVNETAINSPSVAFALETAYLDFKNGGNKKLFTSTFTENEDGILINGLIWMGNKNFMEEQIEEKLKAGYSTLKMKIGAINIEDELSLLQNIRKRFGVEKLCIRVDANGAFDFEQAQKNLDKLSKMDIHSIEQPIKSGQWSQMKALCKNTPVPIALDEELIGLKIDEKAVILKEIQPQYIILKPTLLGGLAQCDFWIKNAEENQVAWWITSALESNIGLNAICQYTYTQNVRLPQGLGTGQLYHNNIPSPLTIKNGKIYYLNSSQWDESILKF